MAQYIGLAPAPADVPGPRPTISAIPTAGPATTTDIQSPTVTNRAPIAAQGDPSSSSKIPTAQRIKNAATLARTYGLEAAPAATVATFTSLGWIQHYTAHPGLEAFGATALAALSGTAAAHGLKHKHNHLFAGGAGLAVALADVAVATEFGLTPASLTVSAISIALGYAALVPWLIKHRKEQRQTATAAARAQAPARREEPEPEEPGDDDVYLADTAPLIPFHNPFYDDVIPYADDTSDSVADPIRLGWDENGHAVCLTMLYRHTLVAGATDWGKSGIMNLIIKRLLRKDHVKLYGIDLKPGAPELGPWEPLFEQVARTPEESRELLQRLFAEGERRGAHLEALSKQSLAAGGEPVKKWIPGNPSAPKDSPAHGHGDAIFVITDELGELVRQDEDLRKEEAELRKADPESYPWERPVTGLYESALALHRFMAIQYVSLTQQPSSRVFGGNTDARGNYTNRISTRVAEAGHAQFVFGQRWKTEGFVPNKLTRPGEFFVAAPEMPLTDPPRVRAEFVSGADIAVDVARHFQQPQAEVRPIRLVKDEAPKPVRPEVPKVLFPDGSEVRRGSDGWLDLYRVFLELCAEQGYATKDDLTARGPYDSRDTVRRAVDMWQTRGVQVRRQGRADQFYLPESTAAETTDSDD